MRGVARRAEKEIQRGAKRGAMRGARQGLVYSRLGNKMAPERGDAGDR